MAWWSSRSRRSAGRRAEKLCRDAGRLRASAARRGDPELLVSAIGLLEDAVALTADAGLDDDRHLYMFNLAAALSGLARATGSDPALLRAAAVVDHLVRDGRGADELRLAYVALLCEVDEQRYERDGDRRHLARMIEIGSATLRDAPELRRHRATLVSKVTGAYKIRYERDGDPDDLRGWVDYARLTLSTEPDTADSFMYHANLGSALTARYQRYGQMRDIDEAVAMLRHARASAGADEPRRAPCLSNLGEALRLRFERAGRGADLDEAVACLRDALDATPDGAEHHAVFVGVLGKLLSGRFEYAGDPADLDRSIELLRAAEAAAPDAVSAFNLGTVLMARYERAGDEPDAVGALEQLGRALAATSATDPAHGDYCSALSAAHRLRYERTGRADDLDESLRLAMEAVRTMPDGHTSLGSAVATLAASLSAQFDHTGETVDLSEAVDVCTGALERIGADDPARGAVLAHVAIACANRFERSGDPADLDRGVDHLREAVRVGWSSGARRCAYLSATSRVLLQRFQHRSDVSDVSDLAEATAAARDAVACDAGEHALAIARYALAACLLVAAEQFRRAADLDEGIEVAGLALAGFGDDDPRSGEVRQDLAHAYELRAGWGHGPRSVDDDHAALLLWEAAATTEGGPTRFRFRAARRWAYAAERLRSAGSAVGDDAVLAAFGTAVALLPLLAPRGSARSDGEDLHILASGLVGEATAAAIAAGDLDRAVELSEAGRSVLWTQLLDTRSDVDRLRAEHPGQAAEIEEVRAQLDAPIVWSDPGTDPDEPGSTVDRRRARRALAGRWQALVDRVRAAPGFEDFLRPASAERIRRMAGDATVVVVNVAPRRCGALLVSGDGIELVALPALDEQTVEKRVEEYLEVLEAYGDREIDRAALEAAVRGTLEWAWDAVAEPVLARTPAPRVWWCPTGPLALLPVHAAGRHNQRGTSVLDRVVSSYAPTIRALDAARRPVATPAADGRMLGVAMPTTPGESDLPGAERDQALLARMFGPRFTALSGPSATRRRVTDSLPAHRWVHFSCHGYQDLEEPSSGGLALHDGTLTGPQIASRRQWDGDFAFLSACQTATGGIAHLDEAITLAAALGYSGWRHVIATLWSVDDLAAHRFARELYPLLVTGRGLDASGSARAVHQAVHRLRQGREHLPTTWALFVHVGA